MPQLRKETKQTQVEYRTATIDKRGLNVEARTVDLSFSSEEPVDRWYGTEILDHEASSIRLGRLMDGGPLLVDHNSRDQVGVVERASIGGDRVGRASVRFGQSERANEIFTDVQDGIRLNVSVGYRVHKMLVDEDTDEFRAMDWEPFEISIVSVPADNSVGVGRAADSNETIETLFEYRSNTMPAPVEVATPAQQGLTETEVAAREATARNEAVAKEQKRSADLLAIGGEYGREDLAREYVSNGKTVDELRSALLNSFKPVAATEERKPMDDLDLSAGDVQEYSLLRALNAAATGDWRKAGYEQECSLAISDKLGREARGFFVPTQVMARTMNTGGAALGAHLVGTTHHSELFIEALRNRAVVGQLGATILGGLQGNVDIPKQTGSAAFGWIAEDADGSDSDVATGHLALSPKTIAGAVPMSRRLLKQGSPSVEQMVRNDLMRGAALGLDLGALSGSGASNQPKGILNTTGIGATAGILNFGDMVDLWSAIAGDNADVDSMAYVLSAASAGTLMQTAKDSGSGIMVMADGRINGYQALVSNQIADNKVLFGNFSQLVIGMWGVLDVVADLSTKAASGGLVLRAFQDADVGVRHAESFAVATAPA